MQKEKITEHLHFRTTPSLPIEKADMTDIYNYDIEIFIYEPFSLSDL